MYSFRNTFEILNIGTLNIGTLVHNIGILRWALATPQQPHIENA